MRPRVVSSVVFSIALATSIASVRAADPEVERLRAQVESLQSRVNALEAEVRDLLARQAAPVAAPTAASLTMPASTAAMPAPSAAYEAEAQGLINDVIRLTDLGDPDGARAKIADLRARYAASKVAGQGTYFSNEIEIIGKKTPADWGIAKWFQGQQGADLTGNSTTIVVFWEQWCPHCRDEMPKLQKLFAAHKGQRLQVVGLTKVTETSSDEKVVSYLGENKIEFPVAKESGTASTYFGVKGIPAAAILKNGKIVWRGHPIRLTDEIVTRFIDQR